MILNLFIYIFSCKLKCYSYLNDTTTAAALKKVPDALRNYAAVVNYIDLRLRQPQYIVGASSFQSHNLQDRSAHCSTMTYCPVRRRTLPKSYMDDSLYGVVDRSIRKGQMKGNYYDNKPREKVLDDRPTGWKFGISKIINMECPCQSRNQERAFLNLSYPAIAEYASINVEFREKLESVLTCSEMSYVKSVTSKLGDSPELLADCKELFKIYRKVSKSEIEKFMLKLRQEYQGSNGDEFIEIFNKFTLEYENPNRGESLVEFIFAAISKPVYLVTPLP